MNMEEQDKISAKKQEIRNEIKLVSELIKNEILEKEKELNNLKEKLIYISEN